MHIGRFQRTNDGFDGRLNTLNFDMGLCLVAAHPSDTVHAPDWLVLSGEGENRPAVGAGWNRTGKQAGANVSLVIDCPSLSQSIRAKLFRSDADENIWHLMWSRPSRRDERA